MLPCPHCDTTVPKPFLEAHISSCPSRPRKDVKNSERDNDSNEVSTGLTGDGRMVCPVCNRKFNLDRISKHQQVCRKVNTKKRGVFDSFTKRFQPGMVSSDVPDICDKILGPTGVSGKWREESLQFRSMFKAAREPIEKGTRNSLKPDTRETKYLSRENKKSTSRSKSPSTGGAETNAVRDRSKTPLVTPYTGRSTTPTNQAGASNVQHDATRISNLEAQLVALQKELNIMKKSAPSGTGTMTLGPYIQTKQPSQGRRTVMSSTRLERPILPRSQPSRVVQSQRTALPGGGGRFSTSNETSPENPLLNGLYVPRRLGE